ncbi:Zinc finger protein 780B [Nymphon striatum]|nr:Zinc finger protein 780B [Nymphon striatum]
MQSFMLIEWLVLGILEVKEHDVLRHGPSGRLIGGFKDHHITVYPATAAKKYPQRKCRVCQMKKGIRRDTRNYCQECNVALCKTSCFSEYHSKKSSATSCSTLVSASGSGSTLASELLVMAYGYGKSATCPSCGKFFKYKTNMAHHYRQKHGYNSKKKFPCHLCNQVFGWSSQLSNHLDFVHSVKKEFECSGCGRYFHHYARAKHHIDVYHQATDTERTTYEGMRHPHSIKKHDTSLQTQARFFKSFPLSSLQSEVRMVKPAVQSSRFHTQCQERVRAISQNYQEGQDVIRSPLNVWSSKCSNEKNLIHRNEVQLNFCRTNNSCDQQMVSCPVCGKDFRYKRGMVRHYKHKHDSSNIFRCHLCSQIFGLANQLSDHLDSIHNIKKEFECGLCGRSFHHFSRAKLHTNSYHPGTDVKIKHNSKLQIENFSYKAG